MKHVCLTPVHATLGETVSVSALRWQPMLKPVIKLASVSTGEHQTSAVSYQHETPLEKKLFLERFPLDFLTEIQSESLSNMWLM